MESIIIDEKIGDTMLRGRLRGLPGFKYDITFCPDQITVCNYSPYMGETLTLHYQIVNREKKTVNGVPGTIYTCTAGGGGKMYHKIYVADDESRVYIS
jgi:hypothetical protein